VLTIGSGPANSIRGAAFLSGTPEALVADVGGTSTDIGMLVNGFPRESAQGVEIGGIRTNFRMPDLVTVALGGGTVLTLAGGDPGTASGTGTASGAGLPPGGGIRVGPESVGYRLASEALVFGGETATLTDAAVAAGRADIGDPALLRSRRPLLAAAITRFDAMLTDAIDRVKTARGDRPLIAVGGGSVLVTDDIPGISEVIRPGHFDAANAIGAAIASVSGQVDRIFHPGSGGRASALSEASEEARDRAVAAGADPDSVETVEIEEIPLAYLTTPAVRIRAKAAGTLRGL
jgi:N-methylhydantoinase A/oxoprolinase/acetone carboxylase beta subunit